MTPASDETWSLEIMNTLKGSISLVSDKTGAAKGKGNNKMSKAFERNQAQYKVIWPKALSKEAADSTPATLVIFSFTNKPQPHPKTTNTVKQHRRPDLCTPELSKHRLLDRCAKQTRIVSSPAN
ncbi:unnamed protein product [Cuscuta europaea]|uniref:Uncharacterized protein n=1 Tax=Cuscuta europaea TaxID=41803 RepID=A0A9P1EJW6_CUSEU|nr:unnamed protein product [Cuscuta europaea]